MDNSLWSGAPLALPCNSFANDTELGFDWSSVMLVPKHPSENTIPSPQVLHFYPFGKSVWDNPSTAQYIQEQMSDARAFQSDADHMRYAVDAAPKKGLVLEFGVGTGRSINFIAALNPQSIIHGFDSFQGLPEDWKEHGIPQGTFRFKDSSFRPPVLNNVRLHIGLFEETLPEFVKAIEQQPIALIHLDADLYGSTKSIFSYLGNHIKPGTILIFDDYFNYPGWEKHEHRAFLEFIIESGYRFEYISYNALHEQVAVRILSR